MLPPLVAVLALVVIGLDGLAASLAVQRALGLATAAVLALALRRASTAERRATLACVAVSTSFELFATQLWGLYGYRFGNVPLYVPPGHGLVWLFAERTARAPALVRHARPLVGLTLAASTAWAGLALVLAGDVHGALYWPFFAGCLTFTRFGPTFAATFVLTSFIELLGTRAGTWHWAPAIPGLGLASGDPPSIVAGGYCLFGLVASLVTGHRPAASRES